MIERLFHLKDNHTDIKTEITAGIVTFLSMSYILAVNPNILGLVMNRNGVFMATAIASAIATLVMAFLANYPIALSAGMGLNAYFAITVCMSELDGEPDAFRIALTAVLIEGIIFILMSLFHFREAIVNGIPKNLKFGISTGIGLFITLLGMENANIIIDDPSTLISMGNLKNPDVALALIGFLIIVILSHFNIKGCVLWGIIITWGLGIIAQFTGWYEVNPDVGLYSLIPDFTNAFDFSGLEETAFKFNFSWAGEHLFRFIAIIFSFLFLDLFDTVGTVVGVAEKANLMDENDNLPRAGRVFMADAIGTTVGACLGTSTVSSFVESATGVGAGGRTGLTSVVTGLLFLLAIPLSPIFLTIPGFATAPALMYVGMLMFSSCKKLNLHDDLADTVCAFLSIIMMVLTSSIANGIMYGVISWVLIKFFTGKCKEINKIMIVIFILFVLRIVALVTGFM